MADRNVIGMAMELDVTDITSGLAQVSKAISQSNTDFKKATAGMDNWSKSSEGLTAKLDQLTTNLELQKKGASGLEAEIKRLQESEGDHSKEIEKAQKKLDSYQIQIANTEKEIRKYSTALEETQKKEKASQSVTSKLSDELKNQKSQLSDLEKQYKDAVLTYGKNSDEAQDLAKEIKSLSKAIDANEAQVDEAEKAYKELTGALEDSGDEAKDAEKSYDSLGDVLSDLKKVSATALVGITAVATAVISLGKSFLATAESTKEFRTNMAKVNASCKESGVSVTTAQTAYTKLYGVLGDDSKTTQAISQLSKLVDNEEQLADWTDICTGVYALFGDSIPIEGLTEASNETAKTGELTGKLGDALKRVGVSEDEFKNQLAECNDEQERQNLITTTLKDLYAEAGKTYRETNTDLIEANEANLRLSKAMAEIGAVAEPLTTKIKNLRATVMEFVADVVTSLGGQELSADDLSMSLDNLSSATERVKKAQDEMKKSLDEASQSSYFESINVLYSAIGTVADNYKEATKQSEKYKKAMKEANEILAGNAEQAQKAMKETGLSIEELYVKYKLWIDGRLDLSEIFQRGTETEKELMIEAIGYYAVAEERAKSSKEQFIAWEKTVGDYVISMANMVETGAVSLETISLYSKELGEAVKEYLQTSTKSTKTIVENNEKIAESAETIVEANEDVALSAEETQKRIEESQNKGLSQTEYYTKKIEEQSEAEAKAREEAQKRIEDSQNRGIKQTEYWRKRQLEELENAKSGWQKFGEGIAKVLDSADESLSNWKKGTGKYLTQIAGYLDTAKGYYSNMVDAITDYYEQEAELQQEAKSEEYKTIVENNNKLIAKEKQTADTRLSNLQASYETDLANLKTKLQNGEITEQQYTARKEARDSAYAQKKAEIETALATTLATIQSQQDVEERRLLEEKNRIGREQFEANKKVQIANVAINTASAIIRAFAELGWIAGLVATASLGVTAGYQIATIQKQQYTPVALAKGGVTKGATQAIIGEDGKEAVLPLEKNTGWIDILASKLNTVMQRENSFVTNTAYGARNISNNFTQVINAPKTPSRRELYRDGKNLLALKGAF